MGLGGSRNQPQQDDSAAAAEPPPTPPPPAIFIGAEGSSLVEEADAQWLRYQMGYPIPQYWGALYLSHRDGRSFTCLLHGHSRPYVPGILGKKRVLLLVRDTGGAVFGAYTGSEWKHPDTIDEEAARERRMRSRPGARAAEPSKEPQPDPGFHGSADCALLTLRPERDVWPAAGGRGQNWMFLQTNWPEEDYNGIGLGGPRFGFHGLFLDRFLMRGHCRGTPSCSTFNSPCLASEPDFEVDEVEAWVVSDDRSEVEEICHTAAGPKKSVLDNKEGKADREILTQAGRAFATDHAHHR